MSGRTWWTPEEKTQLATLARAGVSLGEIGRRMTAEGWPVRERRARVGMIRDLGLSIAGLLDEGEPASQSDLAFLRRYAESGHTDEQAASLLFRTTAETRELARRIGVRLVEGQSRRVKAVAEAADALVYAEMTNGERQAQARAELRRVRAAHAERVAEAQAHRLRDWRERVARGEARV